VGCGVPAARSIDRLRGLLSFEVLFLAIFIATFIIRFAFLDLKLFHHDEAIHAWFSYRLLQQGMYEYDPSYHGPLLYYVTAAVFWVLGDSDLTARLIPSLLGALLIPLVYAIYRLGYLDKRQTLIAALFVAVSPDMVYFSRFLRHDIFMLFFTLLLLVALLYYFERGKTRYLLIAAGALALGLCCKEEMPIIAIIFGSYFIYAIWRGRITLPGQWKSDLLFGALIVVAIMGVLYSAFGMHMETLIGENFAINGTGWYRAVEHWTAMHGQCRLCGPFYFYINLFVLYELPILILAIVGIAQFMGNETLMKNWASRIKNRIFPKNEGDMLTRDEITAFPQKALPSAKGQEFFTFCIYWMILSIAAYGYIGEKVPWLILHQLLPAIFVAVYAMTRKKAVFAVVSALFLIAMTWHVAFVPVDINEPIVQVQNSEELRDLMAIIDQSDHIAVTSDSYWPLPWYYRGDHGDNIVYYAKRVDQDTLLSQDFDLVVAHDTDSYVYLPGFEKRTYRLNYWYSHYENENRLLEYYLKRDGPSGSMNLDVFVRYQESG
jgi:uncharacterized protein (TIGR03663 family)